MTVGQLRRLLRAFEIDASEGVTKLDPDTTPIVIRPAGEDFMLDITRVEFDEESSVMVLVEAPE